MVFQTVYNHLVCFSAEGKIKNKYVYGDDFSYSVAKNGSGFSYTPISDKLDIDDLVNNKGYIFINDEDFLYYNGAMGIGENGTGYIRDTETGKPISAPAREKTSAEKIIEIDTEYATCKADLLTSYQTAMLNGDTDTAASIQAEMQDLNAQYAIDLAALKEE